MCRKRTRNQWSVGHSLKCVCAIAVKTLPRGPIRRPPDIQHETFSQELAVKLWIYISERFGVFCNLQNNAYLVILGLVGWDPRPDSQSRSFWSMSKIVLSVWSVNQFKFPQQEPTIKCKGIGAIIKDLEWPHVQWVAPNTDSTSFVKPFEDCRIKLRNYD